MASFFLYTNGIIIIVYKIHIHITTYTHFFLYSLDSHLSVIVESVTFVQNMTNVIFIRLSLLILQFDLVGVELGIKFKF